MSFAPASRRPFSELALRGSAALWLALAALGQWAFFYYIAAFYGASLVDARFEVWNRLAALGRTPYVPGDTGGNLAFLAHALGAGLVALGGALQLVPAVRARWPRFHRWNGRVFLATVTALSLSGFYLVWIRGTSPSLADAISTTFNGVLILAFARLAYRTARARDFATHRRWALRLYLVSNAQWFLRVGLFSWFVVNQVLGRKVGLDDPVLRFWTFGCYLVPLCVLELYLRAKSGAGALGRVAVAGGLVAIALLMAVGIFAFAMFSQLIISGAPIKLH